MPPNIRKPGSVGRAYDVDLRIQDGEIQVGGSCVMLGYENVDNAEHFTLDGWLRTGDLGQIDKSGFLFLTGRSKDIINRGGEKIAPTEIEHAALRYPYVVEAAAFARPHETLGEEVGLAVTLSQGGTIADLKLALERELAAFKVPRRILVLDPLPRLGSGKIDRRALATLKSASEVDTPVRSNDLTAILVAQAWQKVLPDSTTETLGQTTDFFDAGGDSLAGAQFLFEVERLTGRVLATNLLYEHPEFGAFIDAVNAAPLRMADLGDDPKHRFLQSRLSRWNAPEVEAVPFMRVVNAQAPNAPLFWCVQAEDEYQQLAKAFENDRPLYLMRSLFLMLGKDDVANDALAFDYAKAICVLYPDGDINLGGFCEGAKIMRFAAAHLLEMGRSVRVLISWDQWFDKALDVPVLHLWSDERYEIYQRTNPFPERAIARAHPAGYEVVNVGGTHSQVLTQGPLDPFIDKIHQALATGITCERDAGVAVFDTQTSGEISVVGRRFFQAL